MALYQQIVWLFLIAMPIACIVWTVTKEEVFREPRDFCIKRNQLGKTAMERNFFYLFTCEYCLSHYVTVAFLLLTKYKLLFDDWRGYIIAGFSLVWIANVYMGLFGLTRQGIKRRKLKLLQLKRRTINSLCNQGMSVGGTPKC